MEGLLWYMRVAVKIINSADGVLTVGDIKKLRPEIARDLIKRKIAVPLNGSVPSPFEVEAKDIQITKTKLL
jgi:hypothetical protein